MHALRKQKRHSYSSQNKLSSLPVLPLYAVLPSPCDILATTSQTILSHSNHEDIHLSSSVEASIDLSRHFLHGDSCAVYLPTMEMESLRTPEISNTLLSNNLICSSQSISSRSSQEPVEPSQWDSQSLEKRRGVSRSSSVDLLSTLSLSSLSSTSSLPSLSLSSISPSASLTTLFNPQQTTAFGSISQSSNCCSTISTGTPTQLTGAHRRRLTPNETEYLLQQYLSNDKPTSTDRLIFAAHLNLHPRTIQVWFQNRRAKLRRESTFMDPEWSSYDSDIANNDSTYMSSDFRHIDYPLKDENGNFKDIQDDAHILKPMNTTKTRSQGRSECLTITSPVTVLTPLHNPKAAINSCTNPNLQWNQEVSCSRDGQLRRQFSDDQANDDCIASLDQQGLQVKNRRHRSVSASSPDLLNLSSQYTGQSSITLSHSLFERHSAEGILQQKQWLQTQTEQELKLEGHQSRSIDHVKKVSAHIPRHQMAFTLVNSS